MIGKCFRRYLGLANGISVTGVSVGQMLFPTLIIHLIETYGARNSTIIMAAIILHLMITAILIPDKIIDPKCHPISIKDKTKTKDQTTNCNHVDDHDCEKLPLRSVPIDNGDNNYNFVPTPNGLDEHHNNHYDNNFCNGLNSSKYDYYYLEFNLLIFFMELVEIFHGNRTFCE